MEYLVMETHPAYAVVLGEDGSCLKAANFGYQVGDRVGEIVAMKPAPAKTGLRKTLAVLAAAAACLCIIFFGVYQPNYMGYGSVRMTINPDVLISVSRTDRVVKLKGLNDDGRALIKGFDYKGRPEDAVAAELMSRASSLGYLKDGGSVKLTVSSRDSVWSADAKDDLAESMDGGVSGKSVTIYLSYAGAAEPDTVIAAGTGGSKTYTYAQWKALQAQKAAAAGQSGSNAGQQTAPAQSAAPQTPEQWGKQQGDSWETWGEGQGDSWESWSKQYSSEWKDFGQSVDGLFSGGKSSISDIIDRLG